MNKKLFVSTFFVILIPVLLAGQESLNVPPSKTKEQASGEKRIQIYGFIRDGLYAGKDQNDNRPLISSAFSDFGLKVESGNNLNFKAFADLRFRYGTEFEKPVSRLDIREAFITVNGQRWDISAGQKIIRWGRADFTNPTSRLSPVNYISRSPDPEDMDMANLLLSGKWYPVPQLSLNAVFVPFYRSSVLLTDPLPLPPYVNIRQIDSLITDKSMFGYGLKTDFHLQHLDFSFSWFDGFDPMPGTALTRFNLDLSGPVPVPYTGLTMEPYKIRNIGLDFETTAGNSGFRGEAAWSIPCKSFKTNEYVPLQEIKWVAGTDWTSGNWRFALEYSGKFIPGFIPVSATPILGTETDFNQLAILLSIPGFNLEDYVRDQVGAFNRLYNYQLKEFYHSAGFRVETDLLYGKLTPSVFTLYNFTSHDFFLRPEIKYKPSDGLTIKIGGEFYSGPKGSIYDIINEFMNCFTVALRVDF